MNTSMFLIAALVSGNGRRRNELIQFFMRQRQRSMKRWRHIISLAIALYYTWKGGSLRVKNASGTEVDITDTTLTDSERLRALAEQAKLNSQDQRQLELLRQAVDMLFFWLEDDSDMQLLQADLWRSMDFADAPSQAEYERMEASYNRRFNGSSSSYSGGSSTKLLPDAEPRDDTAQMGTSRNPIKVDARKGGL